MARRRPWRFAAPASVAVLIAAAATAATAASLPSGFSETQLASGIASPTAMAFAPDGRLFVAEQGGRLRVIKNGALLSTSFVNLSSVVDSQGERGLLGVAFDPNFATNQFVYVYYTRSGSTVRNRVVRFTASGDVAVAGSETLVLELNALSSATNHNGGALHFGADGKLYVAVGDNASGGNAQTLGNLLGKILRINKDGTIPTDNPFYNTATGVNRAIWARGLRNPFTFAFQPGTGRMHINDVGENTWEEINLGVAGANYGWPNTEGPTSNSEYRSPVYAYGHGQGCAITGAAFYNPPTTQYPSDYVGDYFFGDYCGGWIRRFDPATGAVSTFATGISQPVDLRVGTDGKLYYLSIGGGSTTGRVFRVTYSNSQAPAISVHPTSQTVPAGNPVTFTVSATGATPLAYQWQRNGVNIAAATSSSYTIASVSTADSGASFRVIVTNSFGTATSNDAILTVTAANSPPAGTITAPASGTLYSGGQTINYSGSGTDPEDGTLPASAFTWEVVFHHDTHTHPFIPPTTGAKTGSFVIPTTGHTETNVFYRIHLTVKDSVNLTHSTFVDIVPRVVTLQVDTSPTGLQVTIDGQPRTAPTSTSSVVGISRQLGAPSPQTAGDLTYAFSTWSDGGAATHTISTPGSNTTYTATYLEASRSANLVAAYAFDEGSGTSTADASGRGHTGTISGASWTTQGKNGTALSFDGVNDWVTVNDTAALDLTPGMTVEAWVFPTRSGGWQTILAKERTGAPSVYALMASTGPDPVPSGKVFLASGSNERIFGATGLPLNTWTHIAVTYDGSDLRFFVNGTQASSRPLSGTVLTTGQALRIGGNSVYGEYFQGRLDDVRVYNRALTAAEIQADMATPVGGGTPPPAPTGLVAAYPFSEGAGSSTADASGLGHAGTISGASWTTQGKYGSALSFDGVNDWVTVADTSALDLTSGMTLEAWVYPTRNSGWQTVLAKERAGQPSVYALMGSTDQPVPSGKAFLTSGANERVFGTATLPLNTWTHIAVTYNGSDLRFFVNGTQAASRSVPGTILTSSGALRLGGNSVYGEYFQGRVDDIRIYNRALAATEIQADMATPVSSSSAPQSGTQALQGTALGTATTEGSADTSAATPTASTVSGGGSATGATVGSTPVVATGTGAGGPPRVRVFAGTNPVADFLAGSATSTSGVFVAVGNLIGFGDAHVVAGAGAGSTPVVRTYWPDGTDFGVSITAYETTFAGGVRVAACDVDADGAVEIVTAPGPGRAPRVKVWKVGGGGATEVVSFLAAEPATTRGVYVACGDVDGDGRHEIVTGLDAGGTADVRVWTTGATVTELTGFQAWEPVLTTGVRVGVADLDGDGRAEVIAATGPGTPVQARAFKIEGSTVGLFAEWSPAPPGVTTGAFVTGADLDGDGRAEVIAGVEATARVFSVLGPSAVEVTTLPPADAGEPSGLPVGAGR